MKTQSHFSMLDPVVSSQARSFVKQSFLHVARRYDPANRNYPNFDVPILLVGSSRGGTTLLSNIVGAHSRILIFHEKFAVGKESHQQTFESTNAPRALRDSFLQFVPHRIKAGNMRWGVKLVANFWTPEDFDRFLQAFPRLRTVFVVRDGRDVVLSLVKRSWRLKTVEQCYERWIESSELFDHLRARLPSNFFWYYYEDLVRDPEPKVREICAYLEEQFEPGMLDHRNWPGLGSYEIAPITTEKVGKWQSQRLPEVSAALTARFKRALEHMGYETEFLTGESAQRATAPYP
jgi:hypothetical protein